VSVLSVPITGLRSTCSFEHRRLPRSNPISVSSHLKKALNLPFLYWQYRRSVHSGPPPLKHEHFFHQLLFPPFTSSCFLPSPALVSSLHQLLFPPFISSCFLPQQSGRVTRRLDRPRSGLVLCGSRPIQRLPVRSVRCRAGKRAP
jgi:hypothetical protein